MSIENNPSPELAAVTSLIALITDPKGCAKRLDELQRQIDVASKAQSKFDTEKATRDRAAAAAEAEMTTREAAVRQREVDVAIHERDLATREQALIAKLNESHPPRYPPDPNLFGTIAREAYSE